MRVLAAEGSIREVAERSTRGRGEAPTFCQERRNAQRRNSLGDAERTHMYRKREPLLLRCMHRCGKPVRGQRQVPYADADGVA